MLLEIYFKSQVSGIRSREPPNMIQVFWKKYTIGNMKNMLTQKMTKNLISLYSKIMSI